MSATIDAAMAERLSKRRARMLPALSIIFLGQQAVYFTDTNLTDRVVDHVHIAAWLVMSVVILLALATGGGWIYPRHVRDLANDEVTRAHRQQALSAGFFAGMAACIILYVISLFEPVGGREAVHLVMTAGIAVSLIWFAVLERRANRDA